ncbi:unnamed protein product [Cylicocyclus nassatus]|uniref:Uncharacterized protein n=1 Tax=Cylicocyclus nassatus TaxID=53992 RepID=A0AA36DWV7_CYLNA|nr:unnamed protein product [Cylicocyclus nassatus]
MNELLEQYYKGDTEPKIIWIGHENGVKLNTRYEISATDLAQKLFDNWDELFKKWDNDKNWKGYGKFDRKVCKVRFDL